MTIMVFDLINTELMSNMNNVHMLKYSLICKLHIVKVLNAQTGRATEDKEGKLSTFTKRTIM